MSQVLPWNRLIKAIKTYYFQSKNFSINKEKRNQILTSFRAKVEHPFQIIKCQWNYRKIRYCGFQKNIAQLHTLCGLANLFMVRKILLNLNLNSA
jgi:IS5 family transposase